MPSRLALARQIVARLNPNGITPEGKYLAASELMELFFISRNYARVLVNKACAPIVIKPRGGYRGNPHPEYAKKKKEEAPE